VTENQQTLAASKEGGDGSTLQAVLEKKSEQIAHEVLSHEPEPGSRIRYEVQVTDETMASRIDEVLTDYRKQAAIPGFRRGKAPAHLVRNRFAREAREEAVRRAVPRLAELIAEGQGVEPLTQPYYGGTRRNEADNGSVATIILEVRPKIEVNDELLKDLEVEATESPVTDQTVEDELTRLRKQNALYEAAGDDAVFEKGDALSFDLEVRGPDGAILPGYSGPGQYSQDIEGQLPAAVVDALVGKKKGDVVEVADVPLSQDAGASQGKFKITLSEVKKQVLPALDDEFAKDVSEEFDTLDKLRDSVRKDLEKRETERKRTQILNGIYFTLSKRLNFDLPASMVENMAQHSITRMEQRLNGYGVSLRSMDRVIVQDFVNKVRGDAQRDVKAMLIADQVGRYLDVEVTDEMIEAEIAKIAEQQGRKPLAVRAQLEKNKQLDGFKSDLRIRAINDRLIGHAKVTIVEKVSEPELADEPADIAPDEG
jgi:trigger factor